MGGIYWLASYPKSGNTWFRAFLKNLEIDGSAPVDINDLSTGPIASARGWLDAVLGFDTAELSPDEIERLRPYVYQWSLKEDEVGYHKIHDAYTLTKNGKPMISQEATLGALYIIRNPLDIASSLAKHNSISVDEAILQMGSREFALSRSKKRINTQVRQNLLTWSDHVLSWADAPHLNCITIRYVDMISSPLQTFTQAAEFLKLSSDPEKIAKAIKFSNFKILAGQEKEKGFREAPIKTSRFFRKGKVGGWQKELTETQMKKIIENHGTVMQRFGYLNKSGEQL